MNRRGTIVIILINILTVQALNPSRRALHSKESVPAFLYFENPRIYLADFETNVRLMDFQVFCGLFWKFPDFLKTFTDYVLFAEFPFIFLRISGRNFGQSVRDSLSEMPPASNLHYLLRQLDPEDTTIATSESVLITRIKNTNIKNHQDLYSFSQSVQKLMSSIKI